MSASRSIALLGMIEGATLHQAPLKPPTRLFDTVTVFDTVRTTVVDTIHVRIADTIGVVIAPDEPTSKALLSAVIAIGSLLSGIVAAVAAWRAAAASKENAAAAIATADASAKQASVAEQQARVQVEQLTSAREALELSTQRLALSLKSLSRRIRVPLHQLTVPGPLHKQLLSYSFLTETDIVRLEELARSVDVEAIRAASKAAVSLRMIEGFIAKAKSIHPGHGWVPSEQDATNWQASLRDADAVLLELEDVCDRIASC